MKRKNPTAVDAPPAKRVAARENPPASSSHGAALVDVMGPRGGLRLKQLLASNNPVDTIAKFQRDNKMVDPARTSQGGDSKEASPNDPVLTFLHNLRVRRAGVYQGVLDIMISRLQKRLAHASPDVLLSLLEQSFPYIGLEVLRRVPVNIMKSMKDIPSSYLDRLVGNQDVLKILPLEVSRRVWELHPKVFESRLDSLLEQYAQDPYRRALVQQLRVEEFASGIPSKQLDIIEYWPKSCRAVIEQSGLTSGLGRGQQRVLTSTSGRRRSADSTLQEMASLIGTSWKLYKAATVRVRTEFIRTGNLIFCMLRMDLLMAFHDQSVQRILEQEPCHRFAWSLDAPLAQATYHENVLQELRSFIRQVKLKAGRIHKLYADLGVIAAHPAVRDVLQKSVMKTLVTCAINQSLPSRANAGFLCEVLVLSLKCFHMFKTQEFAYPQALEIMPLLTYITGYMAEMDEAFLSGKLPLGPKSPAIAFFKERIQQGDVASQQLLQFLCCELLHVATRGERPLLVLHQRSQGSDGVSSSAGDQEESARVQAQLKSAERRARELTKASASAVPAPVDLTSSSSSSSSDSKNTTSSPQDTLWTYFSWLFDVVSLPVHDPKSFKAVVVVKASQKKKKKKKKQKHNKRPKVLPVAWHDTGRLAYAVSLAQSLLNQWQSAKVDGHLDILTSMLDKLCCHVAARSLMVHLQVLEVLWTVFQRTSDTTSAKPSLPRSKVLEYLRNLCKSSEVQTLDPLDLTVWNIQDGGDKTTSSISLASLSTTQVQANADHHIPLLIRYYYGMFCEHLPELQLPSQLAADVNVMVAYQRSQQLKEQKELEDELQETDVPAAAAEPGAAGDNQTEAPDASPTTPTSGSPRDSGSQTSDQKAANREAEDSASPNTPDSEAASTPVAQSDAASEPPRGNTETCDTPADNASAPADPMDVDDDAAADQPVAAKPSSGAQDAHGDDDVIMDSPEYD